MLIKSLHHITALSSNAQKNLDFYAGVLGLRMVKKTINFDSPDVYHLYYGNESGTPGTILTFFIFPEMAKGRKGKGQLTVTSFSVSENSLDYWLKRLSEIATIPPGFTVDEPLEHLGEALKLPPWEEKNRQSIEKILPQIRLNIQLFED